MTNEFRDRECDIPPVMRMVLLERSGISVAGLNDPFIPMIASGEIMIGWMRYL
jgi:hypothetical protein